METSGLGSLEFRWRREMCWKADAAANWLEIMAGCSMGAGYESTWARVSRCAQDAKTSAGV